MRCAARRLVHVASVLLLFLVEPQAHAATLVAPRRRFATALVFAPSTITGDGCDALFPSSSTLFAYTPPSTGLGQGELVLLPSTSFSFAVGTAASISCNGDGIDGYFTAVSSPTQLPQLDDLSLFGLLLKTLVGTVAKPRAGIHYLLASSSGVVK
jgi:hypothetical protein